jgi:hypothetical protein
MKNRWMTWLTGCVCALSLTSVARVEAQLTYGVTVDNRPIAFDAMNPTALTQNVPISGLLQQNELILTFVRARANAPYCRVRLHQQLRWRDQHSPASRGSISCATTRPTVR